MKQLLKITGTIWMLLLLCLLAGTCSAADKVEAPTACELCGMNRTMFAFSRMLITYTDGSSVGTCSLQCASETETPKGKTIASIKVADYGTRKLVDAKKATWVIGGDKQGVMTDVAKWAFGRKADAEAFVKKHGGSIATFDEALKASREQQAPAAHHMH